MSGMVGIITPPGVSVDRPGLRRLTNFMAFRGPDAREVWNDTRVGFGHALLRTTFESQNEQQPCSLDGKVWITADARVDGRPELTRKLRLQGRDVGNRTPDVELILHAYRVWGDDCVHHLIGDFAFALWDSRQQRLFCARDQFGVVPFYYAQQHGRLIFSNTLNCLRLHPDVSDALNEQAIGDFLLFGMNWDVATTTFTDIQRLPPAHTLTWSDGVLRIQRYWTLPQIDGYLRYKQAEDYVEHFSELFQQAVTDRLRTDRISIALSGGLDSTSVAVTARRVAAAGPAPFKACAYTFTFDALMADEERDYANLVAQAGSIPIHYMNIETPLLNGPLDQPEYPSPEPGFLLPGDFWLEALRHMADHSHALLTGFGGDPGLYPVPSYPFDLLRTLQLGHLVRDVGRCVLSHGRLPPLGVRSLLRRWLRRSPQPLPALLNRDFAARLDLHARWEQLTEQARAHRGQRGMATRPFWSNLFATADPGFTSVPVKFHHPFFDTRLVTYLLAVPPVPWFIDKALLRASMRGMLPEPVRQRPKTLLACNPLHALALRRGPPPWMEDLVTSPELAGYVDNQALLRVVQLPEQVGTWEYNTIRQPLILAYWLRHRYRFSV